MKSDDLQNDKDILHWYYPKDIGELTSLLQKKNVVVHGGGTLLIRSGLKNTRGLINLDSLALNVINRRNNCFEIGATTTFAQIIDKLSQMKPDSILVKSLTLAATNPLRNRITLGGSIASFPIWSDLMGPLIALETQVDIYGHSNERIPITEYITRKDIKKASIIKKIVFEDDSWRSSYYRFARTKTDYSGFNITVLWKQSNGHLDDIRIVCVGTRKKFTRLDDVEKQLKGKNIDDVDGEQLTRSVSLPFTSSKHGSAEYLSYLAGVQLGRLLSNIGKR